MPEESKIEQKYKQATEPIKFTEEEMNKVKEIRDVYANVQVQLGQVGVARIRLEQEANNLNRSAEKLRESFLETQTKEEDLLISIKEKYGDGELNPDTGIFTPFIAETK